MSLGFKISAGVLLPLLLSVLVWLPFSPGFWQSWHMAAAQAHVPKIRELLDRDERFKDLKVSANSEMDGSVCVAGVLPRGTSAELKELVAGTRPPRPVLWQVTEFPFEGQRNLPSYKQGHGPGKAED